MFYLLLHAAVVNASCGACELGQYRTGCTNGSAGECMSCPLCAEGHVRVGCLSWAGHNDASGVCESVSLTRLSPLCPASETGVAIGLGGLTYPEAFNFEHNSSSADMQCRRTCDGRQQNDTATCTGPHACGIYSCLMSVHEQVVVDPRRADVCPVAIEGGDDYATTSLKVKAKCVSCTECGHSLNWPYMRDWGRGCARECTQRLCSDENSIYDWTTRSCKGCNELYNSSLCSDASRSSHGLHHMHVTGFMPLLRFSGCSGRKTGVPMTNYTYGECVPCEHEAVVCADAEREFPLSCSTCQACASARAEVAWITNQHTPSIERIGDTSNMYCQISGCRDATKTGIERSGAVCTRSCSQVSCNPLVAYEVPCRLPMDARCALHYPRTIAASPLQIVGRISACANVAEPCESEGTTVSQLSFENALVDESGVGDYLKMFAYQCVWNADGITDNIMHPGGVSASFIFPGYSPDARFKERGTRLCRPNTLDSDFEYPLLPLQNVVTGDSGVRGVYINLPARAALYDYTGEGYGDRGDPATFVMPGDGDRNVLDDSGLVYLAVDGRRSHKGKLVVPLLPGYTSSPVAWEVSVLAVSLRPIFGSDVTCHLSRPRLQPVELFNTTSLTNVYLERLQRLIDIMHVVNAACLNSTTSAPLNDSIILQPCQYGDLSLPCVSMWATPVLLRLSHPVASDTLVRLTPFAQAPLNASSVRVSSLNVSSVYDLVTQVGDVAALHSTSIIDLQDLPVQLDYAGVTALVAGGDNNISLCLALVLTRVSLACVDHFQNVTTVHVVPVESRASIKLIDVTVSLPDEVYLLLFRNVSETYLHAYTRTGSYLTPSSSLSIAAESDSGVVAVALHRGIEVLYSAHYNATTGNLSLVQREQGNSIQLATTTALYGATVDDIDATRVVASAGGTVMMVSATGQSISVCVQEACLSEAFASGSVLPLSVQIVISAAWTSNTSAVVGVNGRIFKFRMDSGLEQKLVSPLLNSHFARVMGSFVTTPLQSGDIGGSVNEPCYLFSTENKPVPSTGRINVPVFERLALSEKECAEVCHVQSSCLWFTFDSIGILNCIISKKKWTLANANTELELYTQMTTNRNPQAFCIRRDTAPVTLQPSSSLLVMQTLVLKLLTPFSEDNYAQAPLETVVGAYGVILLLGSTQTVRRYADTVMVGDDFARLPIYPLTLPADMQDATTQALPLPSDSILIHIREVWQWRVHEWQLSCVVNDEQAVLDALTFFSATDSDVALLKASAWQRLHWRIETPMHPPTQVSIPPRLVLDLPAGCDIGLDDVRVIPIVSSDRVSSVFMQGGVALQSVSITIDIDASYMHNAVRRQANRWPRVHLHVEIEAFPQEEQSNCSVYHIVPLPNVEVPSDWWDSSPAAEAGCLITDYPHSRTCALEYPLSYLQSATGRLGVRRRHCSLPSHKFNVIDVRATIWPNMAMRECVGDNDFFTIEGGGVCKPCHLNTSTAGAQQCDLGQFIGGCAVMTPPEQWECMNCSIAAVALGRARYTQLGTCEFECVSGFFLESEGVVPVCAPCTHLSQASCGLGYRVENCSATYDARCVLCDPLAEFEEFVVNGSECKRQCVAGYYKSMRRICEECMSLDAATAEATTRGYFARFRACTRDSDVSIEPCAHVLNGQVLGHALTFDAACPVQCDAGFFRDNTTETCVMCNVSTLMPADAKYSFTTSCTLLCEAPWEKRVRGGGEYCCNCDPGQCDNAYYMSGVDCESCLPCVSLPSDFNQEYVAPGRDFNTTCKADCVSGFYNRYGLSQPCMPHSAEPNCTSTQYKVVADNTQDWDCRECATCEGMNLTHPCVPTADAVCVQCPDSEKLNTMFVHSNCTEVCKPGFWTDVATGICEYCRYSCPPGTFAAANRNACDECTDCPTTLPSNAIFLTECVWECLAGYEQSGDSACLKRPTVFTTTIVQAPSQHICTKGEVWTPERCVPCAELYGTAAFPPATELDITWMWASVAQDMCAWQCVGERYKHRDSSGGVACMSANDYYATVRRSMSPRNVDSTTFGALASSGSHATPTCWLLALLAASCSACALLARRGHH